MIGALVATAALVGAPGTAVGVGAREFSFSVYRASVPAGHVRLNVRNFGEDAHDVQVFGRRDRSAVSPGVGSGEDLTFTVRLRRPGRYRLVCTKPGHLAAGMRATLRVR